MPIIPGLWGLQLEIFVKLGDSMDYRGKVCLKKGRGWEYGSVVGVCLEYFREKLNTWLSGRAPA